MEGHTRNFSDLKAEKFDDENLPTLTSQEQASAKKSLLHLFSTIFVAIYNNLA